MALALAEQRDEHVGAGHLLLAGGLHMDRGALHHALEPGGGFRVAGAIGGQARQLLVEEFGEIGAQLVEVDAAGAQHGGGVRVLGEAEQTDVRGLHIRDAARWRAKGHDGASVQDCGRAWDRTLLAISQKWSDEGSQGVREQEDGDAAKPEGSGEARAVSQAGRFTGPPHILSRLPGGAPPICTSSELKSRTPACVKPRQAAGLQQYDSGGGLSARTADQAAMSLAGHRLVDSGDLGRRQPQAQLAAPPDHVGGGGRPFVAVAR